MCWAVLPKQLLQLLGCSTEGTLSYTAHELLQLRNKYVPPSRPIRKAIYSHVCGYLVPNERVLPDQDASERWKHNNNNETNDQTDSAAVDRKQHNN